MKKIFKSIYSSPSNGNSNIFEILNDYSVTKNKNIEKIFEKYDKMMIKEIFERIYKIIKEDEQLLYETKDDMTPYIYAVSQNIYILMGLDKAVKKLNEKRDMQKKPWNITNKNGDNIIHLAIKNNKMDILKYILTKIVIDINLKNVENKTPLIVAVEEDNIEAIKLLLKSEKIKLNEKDKNGQTALHYAIILNKMEIFKELMKKRVGKNELNRDNKTPLALAIEKDRKEMAIDLLKKGGKLEYVNRKGEYVKLLEEMSKKKLPIEKSILSYLQGKRYKKSGRRSKEAYKKLLERISNNYKNLCEKIDEEFNIKEVENFAKELKLKTKEGGKKEMCKKIAYKLIVLKRNPELIDEIIWE